MQEIRAHIEAAVELDGHKDIEVECDLCVRAAQKKNEGPVEVTIVCPDADTAYGIMEVLDEFLDPEDEDEEDEDPDDIPIRRPQEGYL